MQESLKSPQLEWPQERLFPLIRPPEHLEIYDLNKATPAEQLSVSTLAGLVNRSQPQIYLVSTGDDDFWARQVLADIPQTRPEPTNGDLLGTLLKAHREQVQGLIIYDPACPDSINVATTLAGLRTGIVVAPSQAEALQQEPFKLPVLADLRVYHWRTRLQAYTWAFEQLHEQVTPRVVAGLSPTLLTGLRSFLVANGALVYWLDSRDIRPSRANGRWATERGLMQRILASFPAGSLHLGWFVDEGSGVSLTSRSGHPVLASDFFFNLEVWLSLPPKDGVLPQPAQNRLPEIKVPVTSPDKPPIYVSFTVSDGDNLQYVQHRMLHLWNDPARGGIPVGWTIPPALAQAAPRLAAHYLSTAKPTDELIAGPSGAGYMFPKDWPAEQYPAFLATSRQLMESMHLTTLQILDVEFVQRLGLSFLIWLGRSAMRIRDPARQGELIQGLSAIGLQGLLSGTAGKRHGYSAVMGVPVYQNLGLATSIPKTVAMLRKEAQRQSKRPLYLNVYVLAWNMTPSDLKQVMQQLGSDYSCVTPGALLRMITAESSKG